MTAQLLRVINQQLINRSILLDKIDESQGNFEGYAQRAKQKVYVPYVNPVDPNVKGYIDLVPTDNVQLAWAPGGVISGLVTRGIVTAFNLTPSLVLTSTITNAVFASHVLTITGTTFLSVTPDITYVKLTNNATLATQTLSSVQISANQVADLITLSNELKTKFNTHAASLVFHTIADGLNAPVVTPNATSLATAITLLNALATAYEAHRILVGLGPVHTGADAVNALAAGPATDLASAILLSNDIKAKFNAHILVTPAVHLAADLVNTITGINGDSFSNTSIKISDTWVTIGVPGAGWKVQVLANSKWSNIRTV